MRRLQEAGVLDSDIDEAGVHWFREEDVEELVRTGIPKLAAQGGWLRDDRTPNGGKVTPIYWRGRGSKKEAPRPLRRAPTHRPVERSFQSSKSLRRRAVYEAPPRRNAEQPESSRNEAVAMQRIRELIGEVTQLPRRQLRAAQRAGITTELADLLAMLE